MTDPSQMQSVGRAARILRILAYWRAPGGWARLADIAEAADIHRGTVHRFLRAWEFEGWVERDKDSRRYRIGRALLALSGTAASRDHFLSVARTAVAALAEKTGDTAYLFQLSAYDAVCMDRQAGDYPVQALATHVGDLVPLGSIAGSLAMLSALDDQTTVNTIEHNRQRNEAFAQHDTDHYLGLIDATRRQGFAELTGAVPGVWGLGVALLGPGGKVVGGLSIAVMKERLEEGHRELVLKALKTEAERVRSLLDPVQKTETRHKAG